MDTEKETHLGICNTDSEEVLYCLYEHQHWYLKAVHMVCLFLSFGPQPMVRATPKRGVILEPTQTKAILIYLITYLLHGAGHYLKSW